MIEEPTLRALIVYYGWPMTPRFSDVRGAITELLRAVTASEDDWEWDDGADGPSVAAWDPARRLHLVATAQGLDIVSEALEDPEPIATDLLASCLETLAVPHVVRCGAVARWLLGAASTGDASAAHELGDVFESDLDESDVPAAAVLAAIQRDRERPMEAAEAIELSARLLAEIREAGEDVLRSLSAAAS